MMDFIVLGPQEKKVFSIAWIEVYTPTGSFVIQRGHVPTILTVTSEQSITICLDNGKQEILPDLEGILEVTRSSVILLLN